MNQVEITTQPQFIAVSRLEKSPLNARRTVRSDGLAELKASILAHGLLQNLVVTESGDGKFQVIAGGRRLEAILSLQAEGKLPGDFAVPCQLVTEQYALEMSLAENTVRLAMHPADQFAAFAELLDKGETAADVAARFGVEESLVHKRMKLARVAPALLQEYRDEGITLECLMAFTITDDHRRQIKVFKSLQEWQKDDPAVIREALTEKMIDASSKLALFVGLEAYRAAGGPSRMDLFSKEVYLEKPALLHRLAERKLDNIRQELEAEGWGWIEINPERDFTLINRCTRIRPQLIGAPSDLLEDKTRLDAELETIARAIEETESNDLLDQQKSLQERLSVVEQTLAAYVGFDTDHKQLAGCFVSIGQDGTPFIDKGLVKPEHRKQLAKLLGLQEGPAVKTKAKSEFPDTLRRELAEARSQAAQVEIAKHPMLALDLLVFQTASAMCEESFADDGADVLFRRQAPTRLDASDSTAASIAFAAIEKALPLAWLKPRTEAARFEAFQALPQEAKLELLAFCVALTLKPKLAPAVGDMVTAYDAVLSLTNADVATYWRPTKDNFLSRISRDQLMAVSRDVLGEAWALSHGKDKKSVLAEQLGRGFTDPDKSGRSPVQTDLLKRWLPACMSFALPAASKPVKSRKTKTAA